MSQLALLSRRALLMGFGASAWMMYPINAQANQSMIVHRDPNCGCCSRWAEYMRQAGYIISVRETSDMPAIRARLGVPAHIAGCHTAEIAAGYVVEGHVPAAAVERLLKERQAIGLAVPGMPIGSPGMEGRKLVLYDVVLAAQRAHMRFTRSLVSIPAPMS